MRAFSGVESEFVRGTATPYIVGRIEHGSRIFFGGGEGRFFFFLFGSAAR